MATRGNFLSFHITYNYKVQPEQAEQINDKTIDRIAQALDVSFEVIQHHDEHVIVDFLKSNRTKEDIQPLTMYITILEKIIILIDRIVQLNGGDLKN